MRKLVIFTLGFFFSIILLTGSKNNNMKLEKLEKKIDTRISVKATYYNPTLEQCDSTPLVTASGFKIDTNKLKQKQIRWVEVSPDLLKSGGGQFRFGDVVQVYSENKRLRGEWIIADVMNPMWKSKVDFLCYNKIEGSFKNVKIKYKRSSIRANKRR